jgi:tetratricopeptide (TPR) repeat protein
MEEGKLDESEKVLNDHTAKHGEEGYVLTNLAKIEGRRGNMEKAEQILWHALELDPNQDNGLKWYEALQRERGEKEGGKERGMVEDQAALRRIAALPKSWRAQLWLARAALGAGKTDEAVQLYRQSLASAPTPVPPDLLMQMSGDLGKSGKLSELIALTTPRFDPRVHGLQVGNNLIKANIDIGDRATARKLVDSLYALQRPDFKQTLGYWDSEIAKARVRASQSAAPASEAGMLLIDGPIWLPPGSPAHAMFPQKRPDTPVIYFLGSSIETAAAPSPAEMQMADRGGRLSRATPLFLTEQLHFSGRCKTGALIPFVSGERAGFMLAGAPWSEADAAAYAKRASPAGEYVVVTHILAKQEPWTIDARVIRTADHAVIGHVTAAVPADNPTAALPELSRHLLALLTDQVKLQRTEPSLMYRVPEGVHFGNYALRLEQLLAVRCAAIDGVPPDFLTGERQIIDGNLQLCLHCLDNLPARLTMAHTVASIVRLRPQIAGEYRQPIGLLQQEHPMPEPARTVITQILQPALMMRN